MNEQHVQARNQPTVRPVPVPVRVGATYLHTLRRPGTDVFWLLWHDSITAFGTVRLVDGKWTTVVWYRVWDNPTSRRQIAEAVTDAHGLHGPVAS